jgi:glucokinase
MYLGIEIGGTKLQLGAGAGDGVLTAFVRDMVFARDGPEGIRQQITAIIPKLLHKAGIERTALRGVGIGFGGPVDDAERTIIKSHQIAGWDNFPLADWISDVVGLPAVLGNDADVAGLGEALHGAGKGLSPIFYITIGSGIGGGFIVDGEIYRGVGKGAAEIGHLRIYGKDPVTGQLGWDILEHRASGWAIGKTARAIMEASPSASRALMDLVQGNIEYLAAGHVGKAAAADDPLSLSIVAAATEYLAEAICHVIALLCPRRIVIGGGFSLVGDKVLFAPLRQRVAERVFKPFAGLADIVPAALGEEVVVHGALALARKRIPG